MPDRGVGSGLGVKGVWSLKTASSDQFDKFLVLAVVRETRVMAITDDDELDEVELPGFDNESLVRLGCTLGFSFPSLPVGSGT